MKYLNKTIEYGLYLLAFLLPLQTRWIIKPGWINNGPWEYGTYSLYATDILLLIILALFVVREIASSPRAPRNDNNNKIICWLLGGLVLASAVSVIGAADRLLALYKFGWLILGLGLFWLITSANYDRLKLIYALCAGAFFSAGLGIWQFLNQAAFANKWLGLAAHKGLELGASVIETIGADGIGERWLRAYGSLDHPNILGGMLALAALFLVAEKVSRSADANDRLTGRLASYLIWLSLAVLTAGLFFSFSRGAWLALAAGLIVLTALAVGRGNLRRQKGLAEAILFMGILSLIFFSQYQNLIVTRLSGQGRLENISNSERLASFKESWRVIKDNWLFGAGPGNYTVALNQAPPGAGSYYYQPAHNVFLLAWAEIGFSGLLFLIGAIVLAFRRLTARPSGPPAGQEGAGAGDSGKIALLASLITLMLFDHWLWSLHFGVLFFWLVLGLIYWRNSRANQLL